MAESSGLSDAKLRVLSRSVTKADLALLSEDELQRLGRIMSRDKQGVTQVPYKQGEGPLPSLPKDTDIPIPHATAFPGAIDRVLQSDSKIKQAETEQQIIMIGLGSIVNKTAKAFFGIGQTPTPEEGRSPGVQSPLYERATENPAEVLRAAGGAIGAVTEGAKDAARFLAKMAAPGGDTERELATEVAKAIYKGEVATKTQFALDPGVQALTKPGEFAFNVADLAGLRVPGAIAAFNYLSKGKKAVNAIDLLETVAKHADDPAEVARGMERAEKVLTDVAHDARAADNPELAERLKKVQDHAAEIKKRMEQAPDTRRHRERSLGKSPRVETKGRKTPRPKPAELPPRPLQQPPKPVTESINARINGILGERAKTTAAKIAKKRRTARARDAVKTLPLYGGHKGNLFEELAVALDTDVRKVVKEARKHAKGKDKRGVAWGREQLAQLRAATKTPDAPITSPMRLFQSEVGKARTVMLRPMAASAAGALIAGTAGARGNAAGEPRFSVPHAVFGGVAGAFLSNPAALRAMLNRGELLHEIKRKPLLGIPMGKVKVHKTGTGGLLSGNTDWEREVLGRFAAVLPDRPVKLTDLEAPFTVGAPALGAAAGFAVGGSQGKDGFSPGLGVLGGLLGSATFGQAGSSAVQHAQGWFNPQQTFKRLFMESRGLPDDVVKIRNRILDARNGRVAEIMDTARVLSKAKGEDAALIQRALGGEISMNAIPEAYKDAAATARVLFDELALDLIEVGLAKGKAVESITNNLGTYLPRAYLRFEQGDDLTKVTNWLRARGEDLSRLSDRNYLKQKKLIPEEIRIAWGEILDNPGYLLGRRGVVTASDIEAHRFMNFVAASPEYTLGKQLGDMAEGVIEGADDAVEVAGFMRGGRRHARYNDKIYRKMPDNPKFGPLQNKYVDESTALDLELMNSVPESLARQVVDQSTAFFKRSKVTWNPATLMRNILGQIPLNDLAGVHPGRFDIWGPALRQYFGKGDEYLEARRGGLFGGEWYGTEIESMLKAGRQGKNNWMTAQLDWAQTAANKPFRSMERFHEASEQANKMIMFSYARNSLKMDVGEAVRYAKRYVFDYREVPRWVHVMRKSPFGAPFISFSYKAIPRVMESALAVGDPRKMMRFWKYPMAFAAVNEYASRAIGVEDEKLFSLSTLKNMAKNAMGLGFPFSGVEGEDVGHSKFLPDYVGDQQILLPWRDNFDRPQYWDLTWTLPWGDFGEIGKGQIGQALGKANIPFPRQFEPSHPVLQLMVAGMTGGKDPFTGKEIISPGADGGESALAMGQYVMRQFGPALLNPAGRSFQKVVKAAQEDVARPDTPDLPTAIGSEVLGLKVRPNDPRQGAMWKLSNMKYEAKQIKAAAKTMKREGASQARVDKRMAAYRAKVKEIQKLNEEIKTLPEVPEKLRKAIAASRGAK